MSKWFEVSIRAYKLVIIEVKDDQSKEEAEELAMDEAFMWTQEKEVIDTAEVQEPFNTANYDEVFKLDAED